MSDDDKIQKSTLTDDEIESTPKDVNRRSAMAILGAGMAGAMATAITGCGRRRERVVYVQQGQPSGGTVYVQAQPQPVVVAQPQPVVVAQPGQVWQSGLTDNDRGTYADPAGNGRGPRRAVPTGMTDGDPGDPGGYGRGTWGRGAATGLTDGDSGNLADPAGNGRGPANPGYTGISDADPSDQGGHGRGHR